MKTDNWISLKSVIPFVLDSIDESLVDEGMIYEWCYNAWDKIENHPMTITKVSFLNIENYQTKLPSDVQKVEMVIYKTDVNQGVEDLSCYTDTTSNLSFYDTYATNSEMYWFYDRNWFPMKRPTGKFQLSFDQCSGSLIQLEGMHQACHGYSQEEYQIYPGNGCKTIKTTFKTGIIGVSYRSKLTDGDDYLIPDDTDVKEAIKSYCMARLWEARWNAKEQGSSERFQYYNSEFALKKAMVKGKYQMPDSEQLEQIRIQRTKLVPKNEQFNKMFSDLASPQLISMMGK
jgi:hypothetical protein